MKKDGFTLIEMLVATSVIVVVGTIVVSLFLSNLRAASKSKLLTKVKQNGNYALSVMERMIRNAQSISNCSGTSSSLKILNPDGGITEFICGDQIASNSGTFLTSAGLKVSDCSFECVQPQGKPAVVTIRFKLSQKGTSLGKEFTAQAAFEATVSARTY